MLPLAQKKCKCPPAGEPESIYIIFPKPMFSYTRLFFFPLFFNAFFIFFFLLARLSYFTV